MKQQIKLTESELYAIVKEAAYNLIREYGDRRETREKMAKAAKRSVEKGDDSTYHNAINSLHKRNSSKSEMSDFQKKFEENTQKECGSIKNLEEEGEEEFNEQPTNNLASESKKPTKITESQLFGIIRESVKSILKEICESGDSHRFGMGKYGLAMDAANKAKALGRNDQAYNLTSHAADAFNDEYGTDGFEMDQYGQLRHRGNDGKERLYRPNSKMNNLKSQINLQGGKDAYDNALRNNSFIKNASQTAKAFPRKKMTGGLNAIETVDNGIYGDN